MNDEDTKIDSNLWAKMKKLIFKNLDDSIDLAQSQLTKAHQRGNDRAVGKHDNRLNMLRRDRKRVVEAVDSKEDGIPTVGELSQLTREMESELSWLLKE